MKTYLLAGLLAVGLTGCGPDPKGREQAAEPRPSLPIPADANDQASLVSTSKTDTVDHFFFTDAYYRRLAVRNQLDMLKLNSLGTLDVVGRDVEKLRYRVGETTADFLTHNLPATDSLPFDKVHLVAWSSDLSGNDEKLFYFRGGRLRQVRKNL